MAKFWIEDNSIWKDGKQLSWREVCDCLQEQNDLIFRWGISLARILSYYTVKYRLSRSEILLIEDIIEKMPDLMDEMKWTVK